MRQRYPALVDQKFVILYNYYIMKNLTQQTPRKTRIHNVLFFRDTPFKTKRVELKTRYKRTQKHRKLEY